MTQHLQIRNLPKDLHRKAKIRAAEQGISMSDWVRRLMERELERPPMSEVYARLRTLKGADMPRSAAEIIREDRDNR